MAAGRNSDGIKRMILELVQGGQGLDQIRQRLSGLGEETAEANLSYAGSLVKVRDDLRARGWAESPPQAAADRQAA